MLIKNIKTLICLIAFSLFGKTMFAQIDAGDKYFERGDYVRAIQKYKKATGANLPAEKQQAYVKLANSYKLLNEYAGAENAFENALAIDTLNLDPEVYYDYAQVLKANNKYDEASEQYRRYIRLNPNDDKAKYALKFIREIKYYLSLPIEYVVTPTSISTEKAEFSPYVKDGKLIFVAERQEFDIVDFNRPETNGQPFLNMFVSDIDSEERIKKAKPFSNVLNSDFHDGPACISTDGKLIYFTRSEYKQKKGAGNSAKLYTAERSGSDWKHIKPIDELNSNDYSVAHPSISYDNLTLFFSSDMPGGFGGKDIWLSNRDTVANMWKQPVNLGPDINTSGDEVFPSIRKDGVLYFSSNGLPGFGGLDIYSAKQVDKKWLLNRNEGLDINSSRDDFGITFLTDSTGYFSSDRVGGKGRDDIFHFFYKGRMMNVEGIILLTENSKDYAKQKKVYLLDENGNVLDSVFTNNKGFFSFKNLSNEKNFMAALDADDPDFTGKARFYLAEKDSSVIHRISNHFGKNKFVFKNMPLDANALPDLSTNDELVLAGNLLYGIDQKPLKNTKLSLVSDKNDVLEETTTNEFGSFAFRNIPSDANYMISVEDSDIQLPAGTKVVLTNRTGKELKTFIKGSGKFSFKLLNSDKSTIESMHVDDENLVMDIYGYMYDQNRQPLINTKVKVYDEHKIDVQEFSTNNKGRFKFKNLDADKNYIFEVEEDDLSLKGVTRIYIADNRGRVYKIVELSDGKFVFKVLEVDKTLLGDFVVNDPWMNVARIKEKERPKDKVDIVGYLFDDHKNPLPYVTLKVHDVNGGDMQKMATNEKGIFNFKKIATEKDYILEADASDPHLKGIKRLYIADGKGDIYKVLELISGKFTFKMLDADKAALGEYIVDDPWLKVALMKEKAKEVTDIMGYLFNQNKQPLVNIQLTVQDEAGKEKQQLKTNEQGRFNFRKLAPDKSYIFEADENDPSLRGVRRIYIADAQGEIYKVLDLINGKFSFRLMDLDKIALADMSINDDLWLKTKPTTLAKVKETPKPKDEPKEIVKEEPEPKKETKPQAPEKPKEPKPLPAPSSDDTLIPVLAKVYYGLAKFKVDSGNVEALNNAVDALNANSALIIIISSHADCRGSSSFNMTLTQKRANHVEKYLVEQGIRQNRIVKKVYGETRLLNQCKDGVKCAEEEHAVNRRTELKLVDAVKEKKAKPVKQQPAQSETVPPQGNYESRRKPGS